MAEEKKKRGRPKKQAEQTEVKAAAVEAAPQLAEKKYDMQTPVRCRSVRQNDLIYQAANGYEYVWHGFGDIRELPYQDVISLKSRRSKFLYEPWLIIEDEDLLKTKEFAGEFDEIYQIYHDFEDPETFFNRKPSEIREILENAPNGLRDLIVYNASKYIDDGVIDSIGVINTIDDVLGTQLKMLL